MKQWNTQIKKLNTELSAEKDKSAKKKLQDTINTLKKQHDTLMRDMISTYETAQQKANKDEMNRMMLMGMAGMAGVGANALVVQLFDS